MTTDSSQLDPATRRFAELAAGGVAVPSGLEAAAAESGNHAVRRGLESLASRLRRGADPQDATLTDIERLVASIVASRTQQGSLSGAILALSSWEDHSHRLRRSILRASLYPLFLLVLSMSVATAAGNQLMPSLIEMIKEFEIEIPAALKAMLWWHQSVWPIMLVGILLATAGLTWLACIGPRWLWDAITRRVPVLGTGLSWLDAADMCHYVSNLLRSESTYPDALRLASAGVESTRLKVWMERAARGVEQGKPLHATIHLLPRDTMVLGTLIDTDQQGDQAASRSWLLAARYFRTMGTKRLELAETAIPIATYIAVFGIGISVLFGMIAPLELITNLISGLGW